jgi:hypothetical protein
MFGSELWLGSSASYICQVLPLLDTNKSDGMSKTSYLTQDLQHELSVFHLPTHTQYTYVEQAFCWS